MLTLKLSHVNWTGAPYRWNYPEGDQVGYSGPAYWVEEPRESIEQRTGRIFQQDRLYDDDENNNVYVGTHHEGKSGTEFDAIWHLWDIKDKLTADFQISRLSFQGEPCHDIETWIGGVRQVTALGEVDPSRQSLADAVNGNDPRFAYLCAPGDPSIEIHTWMGADKKTVRKMIMVVFDNSPTRVMLVERAWLLGSNGDTIQKVCP